MSFHATKLKQENGDLEVIKTPRYQNLSSTSSRLDLQQQDRGSRFFYYYFDRESPWIQDPQREKKLDRESK